MDDRLRYKVWDKKEKVMRSVALIRYRDDGSGEIERVAGHWGDDKNGFTDLQDYKLLFCTELKDKNGKLIYEGDIISNYAMSTEVIFENGMFVGKNSSRDEFGMLQPIAVHHELEIIGNIYENPEIQPFGSTKLV